MHVFHINSIKSKKDKAGNGLSVFQICVSVVPVKIIPYKNIMDMKVNTLSSLTTSQKESCNFERVPISCRLRSRYFEVCDPKVIMKLKSLTN